MSLLCPLRPFPPFQPRHINNRLLLVTGPLPLCRMLVGVRRSAAQPSERSGSCPRGARSTFPVSRENENKTPAKNLSWRLSSEAVENSQLETQKLEPSVSGRWRPNSVVPPGNVLLACTRSVFLSFGRYPQRQRGPSGTRKTSPFLLDRKTGLLASPGSEKWFFVTGERFGTGMHPPVSRSSRLKNPCTRT